MTKKKKKTGKTQKTNKPAKKNARGSRLSDFPSPAGIQAPKGKKAPEEAAGGVSAQSKRIDQLYCSADEVRKDNTARICLGIAVVRAHEAFREALLLDHPKLWDRIERTAKREGQMPLHKAEAILREIGG